MPSRSHLTFPPVGTTRPSSLYTSLFNIHPPRQTVHAWSPSRERKCRSLEGLRPRLASGKSWIVSLLHKPASLARR